MLAIVDEWNTVKNFGWLKCANGRRVFSHISGWNCLDDVPQVGQVVSFELEPDQKFPTRIKAANVRVQHSRLTGPDALTALAGGV